MEKLWLYLFVYLAGAISGIILWEKMGTGDTYRGKVKFSQRGRQNVQKTDIKAEMPPKNERKKKRLERKLNKL